MNTFQPDYRNVVDAAYNRRSSRLPLYEHNVDFGKIEEITGEKFAELMEGDVSEKREFFRHYCGFFKDYGYDVVTFEGCIGQIMPGGGALGNSRIDPVIKVRGDFDQYPWEELPELYFKRYGEMFEALKSVLPEGMKAVGGVGNGVFECVQDLVGYENLCYLMYDDEELFQDLFARVGQVSRKIWKGFLERYGEAYCVLRFGDDLGYKSNTLLPADVIREQIIPEYRQVIGLVHSYQKPFLLHSCGQIFSVMEDLIAAGINAKHSNEDQIAPFPEWVERYGDRIGNFGGIDVDVVCNYQYEEMKEYIHDVIRKCEGHGGFAFGTGNSIPAYVPREGYCNMIRIVREYRGDFKCQS